MDELKKACVPHNIKTVSPQRFLNLTHRPMILDISIWAAFAAGLLSFVSPCVLPLVPPYLCFIAGVELDELTAEKDDRAISVGNVALHAALFVIGFSTVFVALGAAASAIGQLLREHLDILARIAGVVIVIMGLHFLGVFKSLLLAREVRYRHAARPAGLIGAYVIGLAFAFGWTPCIGPVLAAILAVAASEESVSQGALLLAIYSAGLGVPFMLAALGINQFLAFSLRFRKHMPVVEKMMGGLLVVTGVLFVTGDMQRLSFWLLETFPSLGNMG